MTSQRSASSGSAWLRAASWSSSRLIRFAHVSRHASALSRGASFCLDRTRAARPRPDEAVRAHRARGVRDLHVDRDAARDPPRSTPNDELGVGSFGVALAIGAVSPMILVSQPIAGRIGDRSGRASSSSRARSSQRPASPRTRSPSSLALLDRVPPPHRGSGRRWSSSARRRWSPTSRPSTAAARR